MDLTERGLSLIVAGDLEQESGHLTVIARALVPDDFLLITSLANTLSFLDDLSQTEAVNGIGLDATLASDVRDSAGSTGSWLDFVQTAPAVT